MPELGAVTLGYYDLFYDTHNPEQIAIGQGETIEGVTYYDFWMSFAQRRVRDHKADGAVPLRAADALHVDDFKINTTIHPPNDISAEADLDDQVRQGGPRVHVFRTLPYPPP